MAVRGVSDIISVASSDVKRPFFDTIKDETTLGRGRSLPEAMAESALGLIVVHRTVKGVAFCGIRGGRWPRPSSGEVEFSPEG
jgi:hypothetical protein